MPSRLFDQYFDQIDWFVDVLDRIYNTTTISLRAKKEIHEAYILKIHLTWEIFTEEIIIRCLKQDASQYADFKGIRLPKRLSNDVCRALLSGIGYFDIKNASNLKKNAKDILVDTFNPFKEIPSDVTNNIDEFYIIRNYIAHRSWKAKRSLQEKYRKQYHFRRFLEPGDFLLKRISVKQEQVYFSNYVNSFITAANIMEQFLKSRL